MEKIYKQAPAAQAIRPVIEEVSGTWHDTLMQIMDRELEDEANTIIQSRTNAKKLIRPAVSPRINIISGKEFRAFHEAIGVIPDEEMIVKLLAFIGKTVTKEVAGPLEIPAHPVAQYVDQDDPGKSFLTFGDGTKFLDERQATREAMLEFHFKKTMPNGVWLPDEHGVIVATANRPVTNEMLANFGSVLAKEIAPTAVIHFEEQTARNPLGQLWDN